MCHLLPFSPVHLLFAFPSYFLLLYSASWNLQLFPLSTRHVPRFRAAQSESLPVMFLAAYSSVFCGVSRRNSKLPPLSEQSDQRRAFIRLFDTAFLFCHDRRWGSERALDTGNDFLAWSSEHQTNFLGRNHCGFDTDMLVVYKTEYWMPRVGLVCFSPVHFAGRISWSRMINCLLRTLLQLQLIRA